MNGSAVHLDVEPATPPAPTSVSRLPPEERPADGDPRLASTGIRLDAITASLIALAINLGAYTAEIMRAGLEAIPRSQVEAGHSLGLSGLQVFRHVVMFPALKVIYPSLTSQFVLIMLATSVVSQISTPDLFHVASIIQSRTFRDFEIYFVIAILYLLLALALRLLFAAAGQIAFGRR